MNHRDILKAVQNGTLSVDDGVEKLKAWGVEDLGFAKIDHHRALRKGFPEVVYCEGKTTEQSVAILLRLAQTSCSSILGTRANKAVYDELVKQELGFEYYEQARIVLLPRQQPPLVGNVLVVCAGTSDLPVAEEAEITLRAMGANVERLVDVGVAGLQRLLSSLDVLYRARVLVVVAGMEGALPSVVAGLVDKPVIAVPTSVGYGTNFSGLTALLSMLNSCASGLSVVNIDNGFGAGYLAALINRLGN